MTAGACVCMDKLVFRHPSPYWLWLNGIVDQCATDGRVVFSVPLSVCVYESMYAHVRMCVYMCAYACVYVLMHVCIHVCMYVCEFVFKRSHVHLVWPILMQNNQIPEK